jgi:hypothetical protein
MLGGTMVLLVTDVLETSAALSGFANPGVATVAALYVVARARVHSASSADDLKSRACARRARSSGPDEIRSGT